MTPEKLAFDDIALLSIPLPRPLDELASKAELHRWLGHLLLCTLCNGTPRAQPGRVEFPNNINAFLHVLIHLHRVGFPAHWISEFLQSMVSNNLITTAQPYLDKTPIPSSEARNRIPATKIHLEAWQAEFQNIIASTLPATPFALNLPQDYPTYDEIRTFKATVKPLNLEQHPAALRWGSLIYSGRDKTAGLLFYKPTQGIDAEFITRRIPGLFTGIKELRDIQVQIMLCPETFDMDGKKEVSWKMSQAWYDRMKKEKWCMAVYRTDIYINGESSCFFLAFSDEMPDMNFQQLSRFLLMNGRKLVESLRSILHYCSIYFIQRNGPLCINILDVIRELWIVPIKITCSTCIICGSEYMKDVRHRNVTSGFWINPHPNLMRPLGHRIGDAGQYNQCLPRDIYSEMKQTRSNCPQKDSKLPEEGFHGIERHLAKFPHPRPKLLGERNEHGR